jgi:hypothetical protein
MAASAPAGEFSAERAMVHVRAIAQRPHPLESADHERVRTYISTQFQELGTPAGIHSGIGQLGRRRAHVENLVARLPGASPANPILLAAHYDSTAGGPGAGDDAHGVAVLLETLRALRAGPPLRNDVIFLITDGEEAGLLGAAMFAADHPWRLQPRVVLNFEARGTGGRPSMFETSNNNEQLVRTLQTAAPWANATSLAYEIYRRMPNSTDLTVFKRAGLSGMNFAFIDHPEWYHHMQDDPDHLDQSSLQEQGNYALALTRAFGGQDLSQQQPGNAVYFPTPLTSLIVYSNWLVVPLAWMTALALVLAAVAGWRRGRRGVWIAALLAIPAGLHLLTAGSTPGASYLLEWPLFGGTLAFAVLMTATRRIGAGWELAVLLLAPAFSFLLILPMISPLIVALGVVKGGVAAAIFVALLLITVAPQLFLMTRPVE